MREPIDHGHLFRLDPSVWDVSFDGKFMTIDNFYSDPQSINDWLKEQDYPRWKYLGEPTRNGIDYDDCRLCHAWPYEFLTDHTDYFGSVMTCVQTFFWDVNYQFDRIFQFNCFRSLKDYLPTEQQFPHRDGECLNMVIFMDQDGNGGTDLYDGEFPGNEEYKNLMFDLSSVEHSAVRIPYKFNRAAVFDGRQLHGASIQDHSHYKNSWRYTQVYFLYPTETLH